MFSRYRTFVYFIISVIIVDVTRAKIFDRCDLARTLHYKHNLSHEQASAWVCIARYQSGFNSAAVNYDGEGTGHHGLYQISDRYWCSTSGRPGNECNIQCSRFRDDDLTDDFACIGLIFAEHERLSGSGYNAWPVFGQHCAYNTVASIEDCFKSNVTATTTVYKVNSVAKSSKSKVSIQNKIYHRCELARELRYVHDIPMDQIATWVCIAKHVSNLNTSAVSSLAHSGSSDHGLFQISDIYWCSPPGMGWVCGLSCAKLEDSDITDDVECMRKIYDEHQRLSGDGFNAWAVYRPYCQHRSQEHVEGCFDGDEDRNSIIPYRPAAEPKMETVKTGKVYSRCELANELRNQHNIPEDQLAMWVCIAYHESRYNTSAIGRLNADGSGDHGIFQISDIYWCSPPGNGWVCGLSCAQLEDNDITDDVRCMRLIHAEHERLSGDGFNAWAVYNPYCRGRADEYTVGCFDDSNTINFPEQQRRPAITAPTKRVTKPPIRTKTVKTGKIYDRCELARELRYTHKIPLNQIGTWVCIAKHESSFNTSAVGHLNDDGSGDHGLFQISDIYWCSPPGNGWVCGLTCAQLEDSDITDDVECMKKIHEEHERLSGDGFNAWAVYDPYCRGSTEQYMQGCFEADDNAIPQHRPAVTAPSVPFKPAKSQKYTAPKVYDRCELARELRYIHNIPLDQIATWVCIAKHESSFNTSAVGRLNSDGSGDHGLFQISDIYWCSPPGNGWVCGLTCAQLEDSDITDDVECMRKIHEEHSRISGDGFNAWSVYNPHCRGRADKYITGCFDEDIDDNSNSIYYSESRPAVTSSVSLTKPPATFKSKKLKGKIYKPCELAIELRDRHNIPMDQIGTWVCIAKHESQFNTSAIGYGDHGLFQISDIYWCSPPGRGWACGLPCSDLEDIDITDDVECMLKIFEEHQRLSGDGFNAWTVYPLYCKGRSMLYVKDCFEEGTTTEMAIPTTITYKTTPPPTRTTTAKKTTTTTTRTTKAPPTTRTTTKLTTITSTPRTRPTKPTTKTTTKKAIQVSTKKPYYDSEIKSSVYKPVTLPTVASLPAGVATRAQSLATTEDPFAIYFNHFQTKKPTTFYKFASTTPRTTSPTASVNGLLGPSDKIYSAPSQVSVTQVPLVSATKRTYYQYPQSTIRTTKVTQSVYRYYNLSTQSTTQSRPLSAENKIIDITQRPSRFNISPVKSAVINTVRSPYQVQATTTKATFPIHAVSIVQQPQASLRASQPSRNQFSLSQQRIPPTTTTTTAKQSIFNRYSATTMLPTTKTTTTPLPRQYVYQQSKTTKSPFIIDQRPRSSIAANALLYSTLPLSQNGVTFQSTKDTTIQATPTTTAAAATTPKAIYSRQTKTQRVPNYYSTVPTMTPRELYNNSQRQRTTKAPSSPASSSSAGVVAAKKFTSLSSSSSSLSSSSLMVASSPKSELVEQTTISAFDRIFDLFVH